MKLILDPQIPEHPTREVLEWVLGRMRPSRKPAAILVTLAPVPTSRPARDYNAVAITYQEPEGTICVVRVNMQNVTWSQFGKKLAHEFAHCFGAGEEEARKVEGEYYAYERGVVRREVGPIWQ